MKTVPVSGTLQGQHRVEHGVHVESLKRSGAASLSLSLLARERPAPYGLRALGLAEGVHPRVIRRSKHEAEDHQATSAMVSFWPTMSRLIVDPRVRISSSLYAVIPVHGLAAESGIGSGT